VAAHRETRPIEPEQGSGWRQGGNRRQGWHSRSRERIRRQRLEDGTDAAWFFGGWMFLTLLAQGTNTAEANAACIQDAQRAIVFGSALLRVKGMISGTAQGAVGLQRKRRARKTAGKRAFGPLWRTIDDRRGWLAAGG